MNEKNTILLVDDSRNDLILMQAAIQSAGFKNPIQEVYDGEEAIAYLTGEGKFSNRNDFPIPGLILLDLNMPRKNGFDVLRWVRGQTTLRRIPIMIFTTSTLLGDIDMAYALGANAFLTKPSDLNDLIATLKSL